MFKQRLNLPRRGRFYDISEGRITLDGRNIKELNVRWLRTQVRKKAFSVCVEIHRYLHTAGRSTATLHFLVVFCILSNSDSPLSIIFDVPYLYTHPFLSSLPLGCPYASCVITRLVSRWATWVRYVRRFFLERKRPYAN